MLYGIGVNDAGYSVRVRGTDGVYKMCPYYRKWTNMLKRCYSEAYNKNLNAYDDCTVCDEWLIFSNFKAWMEQQDWEGKELDKDLLSNGSKVYSPETCLFVSRRVNLFLTDRPFDSGLPYGVCVHGKRYQAGIRMNGKRVNLGLYDTIVDAHNAWFVAKNKMAVHLVNKQTDKRISDAIVRRLNEFKTETGALPV